MGIGVSLVIWLFSTSTSFGGPVPLIPLEAWTDNRPHFERRPSLKRRIEEGKWVCIFLVVPKDKDETLDPYLPYQEKFFESLNPCSRLKCVYD